jgi:hypothetical protein
MQGSCPGRKVAASEAEHTCYSKKREQAEAISARPKNEDYPAEASYDYSQRLALTRSPNKPAHPSTTKGVA